MRDDYDEFLDYPSISWKKYQSKKSNTGVVNYSYGEDFIWIEYQQHEIYLYLGGIIGMKHINKMKELADTGEKLSGYKSSHRDVHGNFSVHYKKQADGRYRKVKINQRPLTS